MTLYKAYVICNMESNLPHSITDTEMMIKMYLMAYLVSKLYLPL